MLDNRQEPAGINQNEELSVETEQVGEAVPTMNEIDSDMEIVSGVESAQLVPVSEAIRYRKRAQAAEKKAEQLAEQLRQNELAQQQAQEKQDRSRQEMELTKELVAAGAMDVEAALLLAQRRMKSSSSKNELSNRQVIEALRQERPYLFGGGVGEDFRLWSSPTAGVRSGGNSGGRFLSHLAERARSSGDRRDMQEYLRMRRSVRR